MTHHTKQIVSNRRKGNQGDWRKPIDTDRYGTAPEHLDHNKEIEARRQDNLAARAARKLKEKQQ